MKEIGDRQWEYAWLPTAAVQALVAWLAATLYRPHGKFKQALAHLSQAQQVIDEELRRQGIQVRLAAQIEKKEKSAPLGVITGASVPRSSLRLAL